MRKFIVSMIFSLVLLNAHAAEADIGPVYVASIMVTSIASGGHQAGNMEVEIEGGFKLPSGISCDTVYITTLKSQDPDLRLFAMLTSAQLKHRPVRLRISNDPALAAFDGRCSVVGAVLLN